MRFLVLLQWYLLMAIVNVRVIRIKDIQVVVVKVGLRDAPRQNSLSEVDSVMESRISELNIWGWAKHWVWVNSGEIRGNSRKIRVSSRNYGWSITNSLDNDNI